ncbi:uncharacterized protein [Dendrobates tinctorius]|uniref:uncharacterized protein n=1 Tax=Dendrobates tinctorius TaxID=92724 RepID=UPI003CC98C8E
MTSEALKTLNDDIDAELQKWANDIQSTKARKFKCDIRDKQSENVYRWRISNDRSRPRNRNFSYSRSRSASVRSNISQDINPPNEAPTSSTSNKLHTRQASRSKNPTGKQPAPATQGGLQVINLSTRSLTPAHLDVLGRGLTFSLTNAFDYFTALKDLHLFSWKLVLKKLHYKRNTSGVLLTETEEEALRTLEQLLDEQSPPLRSRYPPAILPKSFKFPPLSLCLAVEIFTKLVSEDLKSLSSRCKFDNLTYTQRQAIKELQSFQDIVIKPADKGGGNIVIWPSDKYEKEAFRQLRDVETYTKLSYNPLSSFSLRLQQILLRAVESGTIDKKVLEGLTVRSPKVATFYLLPKIHKDALDPPGRPIVSGIVSLCDPVCRFIDYYLNPWWKPYHLISVTLWTS